MYIREGPGRRQHGIWLRCILRTTFASFFSTHSFTFFDLFMAAVGPPPAKRPDGPPRRHSTFRRRSGDAAYAQHTQRPSQSRAAAAADRPTTSVVANGGGSTTHDSMVAQGHHLQVDVKKICKRTGPSRGRSKVFWSVRTQTDRPSFPHMHTTGTPITHRARLIDNGSGCRSTSCEWGIRSIGSSLGANAGVLAGGRRHRSGRVLRSKVLHPPYSVIIVMMV